MTAHQRTERRNMRAFALLFRDTLKFARAYRANDPRVYERFCLHAGGHLEHAIEARNNSQPATPQPSTNL